MRDKILNLRGVVYEGEVKSANVKTLSGEITILDHHRPMISILAARGKIRLESQAGEKSEYEAPSGFLHLNPVGELAILVD